MHYLLTILLTILTTQVASQESLMKVFNSVDPSYSQELYGIHDPSRFIDNQDGQILVNTGKENAEGYNCGLETWRRDSANDNWKPDLCLVQEKPEWINEEMPEQGGAYWAPDFTPNGHIVYSVTPGFDEPGSCVGLLKKFESTWKDIGQPITCSYSTDPEIGAIDPSVFKAFDGRIFLVTGGGLIHMSELDPNTYESTSGDWFEPGHDDWFEIARGPMGDNNEWGDADPGWIEAAYIYPKNEFYYLFVNWGACCSGIESTYNIRVGRSISPTGPYLDKEGVNMMDGGGSLLLGSQGNEIGPGHAGIWSDKNGQDYISYHYYDKNLDGKSWAGEQELNWISGWPSVISYQTSKDEIKNEVIVMLGDSISEGVDWNELMDKTSIINKGVGGDTINGFVDRIDDVINLNPSKVFIMGGINDLIEEIDIQIIYTNYVSIIEALREHNIETIIQSTLYTARSSINQDETYLNENVKLLNRRLESYASSNNIDFVDLNTKLSNNEILINKYTTDGYHLNAKGYSVWKGQLKRYI